VFKDFDGLLTHKDIIWDWVMKVAYGGCFLVFQGFLLSALIGYGYGGGVTKNSRGILSVLVGK
jgi:hypothetical protein